MDAALQAKNMELEDLSISDNDINAYAGGSKYTVNNNRSGNSTMMVRND